MDNNIYPLTIIKDRYSGVYSGGEYTAWNLAHDEIPTAIDEDDVTCRNFWKSNHIIPIGVGMTIEEAVESLKISMKNALQIDFGEPLFTASEVGAIIAEYACSDKQFNLGDKILYSPTEIVTILERHSNEHT